MSNTAIFDAKLTHELKKITETPTIVVVIIVLYMA